MSYYLSDDATWVAGDTLLTATGNSRPALAAGATDTFTASVTLPAGVTGNKYVIAYADWNGTTGTISEYDETNNTRGDPIHIAAGGALAIEISNMDRNFFVPVSDQFPVLWTIQNASANAVVDIFVDTDHDLSNGPTEARAHITNLSQGQGILRWDSLDAGSRFWVCAKVTDGANVACDWSDYQLWPCQIQVISEQKDDVDVYAVLLGPGDLGDLSGKVRVKPGKGEHEISSITISGAPKNLGIIVTGDDGVARIGTIKNTNALDELAFLWLDALDVGTITIKGGLTGLAHAEGARFYYQSLIEQTGGVWVGKFFDIPADADEDGWFDDPISFYTKGRVGKLDLRGAVGGDMIIHGSCMTISLRPGIRQSFSNDIWVDGDVNRFGQSEGNFEESARMRITGNLGSLTLRGKLKGDIIIGNAANSSLVTLSEVSVDQIEKGRLIVHGTVRTMTVKRDMTSEAVLWAKNLGKLSVQNITLGSLVNAAEIGSVTVKGSIVGTYNSTNPYAGDDTELGKKKRLEYLTPSMIVAGHDVLGLDSTPWVTGRIDKLTVKGGLSFALISVGTSPGPDGVWGSDDDLHPGAGKLPVVNVGAATGPGVIQCAQGPIAVKIGRQKYSLPNPNGADYWAGDPGLIRIRVLGGQ